MLRNTLVAFVFRVTPGSVDILEITPPTKTHTHTVCLDFFLSGEVNVFPGVCEQQEEV